MNDFKDLNLDYFAPRKPAEPEAKPEKTEAVDAPTADESAEPAERRRKPKPSRRELLNMRFIRRCYGHSFRPNDAVSAPFPALHRLTD